MRYIFVVLVTMMMSFGALAARGDVIDISQLTPEQQQQVKQMVADGSNPVVQATSLINRVEEFGSTAAKGIVAFAKELGVAANEFIQTPVGVMVVIGMVVFFAAGKVVGMLFTFIVAPVFMFLAIRAFRPIFSVEKSELKPVLWGLWQRRFVTERRLHSRFMHESHGFYTAFMIGGAIISIIIGLANLL